jgi:putative FmdB family regulatory protein
MPIYPYLCNNCGHEFDRLQKISDDPLKVCPECGAESLRKKLTAASFQLKGTGWYETDFKNKGKKGDKDGDRAGDKSKAGDGSNGKKGDKKSDTKSSESKSASTSSTSNTSKSTGKSQSTSSDSG